jgi:hypothetical protein
MVAVGNASQARCLRQSKTRKVGGEAAAAARERRRQQRSLKKHKQEAPDRAGHKQGHGAAAAAALMGRQSTCPAAETAAEGRSGHLGQTRGMRNAWRPIPSCSAAASLAPFGWAVLERIEGAARADQGRARCAESRAGRGGAMRMPPPRPRACTGPQWGGGPGRVELPISARGVSAAQSYLPP